MLAQLYCLSFWTAGLVGAPLVLHFVKVILVLIIGLLALLFVDLMEFLRVLACLPKFWVPDIVEEVDCIDEFFLQ